jgi:hypothetical protein
VGFINHLEPMLETGSRVIGEGFGDVEGLERRHGWWDAWMDVDGWTDGWVDGWVETYNLDC